MRLTEAVVQVAAQELRADPTLAERHLWEALRKRRVAGLHFRRQHPIGGFIADFCCTAIRLIVEVDGSSHDGMQDRDEERDARLTALGYTVLRFTNEQVLHDRAAVLRAIAIFASTTATSDPP